MDEMSLAHHHEAVMGKLCDIDHDTDALLKMEAEESMHGAYDSGLLAGMLSKQGIDAGELMAIMNNNRRDGTWGDDGLMFLLLILLLGGGRGWGNGFGGPEAGVAGVDRTVVNEANYTRLLDAISTNGTRQEMAVQSLATNLNCDLGQIKSALCGVDKQIALAQGSIEQAVCNCCCKLGSKIDGVQFELSKQMSDGFCGTNLNIERSQNAIQRQLSDCCCEQRANIADLKYNVASQFAAQSFAIQQAFCDQNAYLAKEFCDIKSREDAREIQALRDQLADAKADARALATVSAVNAGRTFNGTLDATTGVFNGTVPANVFP